MAKRKKPETQKQQLAELWDEVVGTNGEGISEISRDNQKEIHAIHKEQAEMKADIAYMRGKIDGCLDTPSPTTTNIHTTPISNKTKTIRRVLEALAIGVGIAIVLGLFVLLAIGRIDTDDIIKMLEAYYNRGN